jgi:hypothetical protein
MRPVPRPRRIRGVSAIEYVIVAIVVAIGGIAVERQLGASYKCRLAAVVARIGGGEAPACGDAAGGAPPATGGGDANGGTSCPGGSCMVGSKCFVAGTLVLTESGPQAIETIPAGTEVLTRDPETGANEWQPVVRTLRNVSKALVRLTLEDGEGESEELELTPSHPLFVDGRGWIAAGELEPGRDLLVSADGQKLVVRGALLLPVAVPVYNLEVAALHSYFVGRHGVWAHNADNPPSPEQIAAWENEFDQLFELAPAERPPDWAARMAVLEAQLRDASLSSKPKKSLSKEEQEEKKQLDKELGRLNDLDKNEKKALEEIARLEKDKPKNWEDTVKKLKTQVKIDESSRERLFKDMTEQFNNKVDTVLEEIHQKDIESIQQKINDTKKKIANIDSDIGRTNGKTPQYVVDDLNATKNALNQKLSDLESSLKAAKDCPAPCAVAPKLEPTDFDKKFKKGANKKPIVDSWIYNGFKGAKTATTTGLTIVDHTGVGTAISAIVRPIVNSTTGAVQVGWDAKRYATYGKQLENKLNQLVEHRKQIPNDPGHAVDRAVTNFAIQQISSQLDKYHEAVRDGIPNTLLSMIPFVDPHVANPYKIYKYGKQTTEKFKTGFGNETAKASKFLDKNSEGDIRDNSVEKKTGARVLLDAASLNDNKNAQKVMGIMFGDDVANKFSEEWQKVYSVGQQAKQNPKYNLKKVNPFVDSELKADNFIKKYQGQKPVPVTADNDPNGAALYHTENALSGKIGKLGGTRPPRYMLEPDESVAAIGDDTKALPSDYKQTFPLKNYDRNELKEGIGSENVGPKGKWGEALNTVKKVAGKDTSFPDDALVQAVADQLSASPSPRNPIVLPSTPAASTSASTSNGEGTSTSTGNGAGTNASGSTPEGAPPCQ